jgi:hypothetical protein
MVVLGLPGFLVSGDGCSTVFGLLGLLSRGLGCIAAPAAADPGLPLLMRGLA